MHVLSSRKARMFKQYLQSYQYQNSPAGKFSSLLEPCSEHVSDFHAHHRNGKRRYTYERNRRENIYMKEREGHTYRQSVNACGESEGQHFRGF